MAKQARKNKAVSTEVEQDSVGVKSAKDLLKLAMVDSKNPHTSLLSKTKLFENHRTKIDIPLINIPFSGELDGGMGSGIITIAGPSKTFKSLFALMLCSFYLKYNPEAILVFLDSEFGARPVYFDKLGIDKDRVLHVPVTNLEEFKFEMVRMLSKFGRGDKVIFAVDSIGNLASLKEVEDAEKGKSSADMTRARVIRSIHRIITPRLCLLDVMLIEINHVYSAMDQYSGPVVSGGSGGYYASDDVWIVSRQQITNGKEGKERKLLGWNFTITVDKSRTIAEKTKFDIEVYQESGIYKYSGIFEEAKEAGFVVEVSKGWYTTVNLTTGEVEDKKVRASQLDDYFAALVVNDKFKAFIKEKYKPSVSLIQEDEETEKDQEFLEGLTEVDREDNSSTLDV